MTATPSRDRYASSFQAIHWLTAIIVLVAFIYGPGGSESRVYSAARDADRQLHETLGLTVLLLSLLRLGMRAVLPRPAPVPAPAWMLLAARTVQVALYVLLFIVPLSAMTGAWLQGHALTLLGGVQVPPAWAGNHSLGTTIAGIHTWLGDVILWVAGLHACAAIYHHAVLKDGVLASMLPGWMVPGRAGRG